MAGKQLQDMSFLYVEDDPRSRKLMNLILTKAMQVKNITMFADSTDFEARIVTLTPIPDVILLDIHVEPYDGFEMLAMVRQMEQFRQSKVVALTASVMNEEVKALKAKGFDATISKPLKLTEFPTLIERIVNGESIWHIL